MLEKWLGYQILNFLLVVSYSLTNFLCKLQLSFAPHLATAKWGAVVIQQERGILHPVTLLFDIGAVEKGMSQRTARLAQIAVIHDLDNRIFMTTAVLHLLILLI